jgi:poly-gamma-glutamate synthesis protein (capsule biosynthesis protein)
MMGRSRRDFLKKLAGLLLAAAAGHLHAGQSAGNRNGRMAGTAAGNVRLFLAGDVMTGRGIDQVLPYPGDPELQESYVRHAGDYVTIAEQRNGPIPKPVSFDYIWGDALAVLDEHSPAARIINLETTVTTSEVYWPKKPVHYRMHPANVPCLTAAGIDCCVLANNHALDFGHAGLAETLAALQDAGIRAAGAGRNHSEAAMPAILEIAGGGRVLVFGFGHASSGIPPDWRATASRAGIRLLDVLSDAEVDRIAKLVNAVRRQGDLVIASIHWGGNWGYEVPAEQRHFAHGLVDRAGVDVVHGHSSHHPKGIEVYKNRPVFYGCGDLINDYEGIAGHDEYRGELALMYFPEFDGGTGDLIRLEIVPMRIRRFRLQRAGAGEAGWLAGMLAREGKQLGTRASLMPGNIISLGWSDQ